MVIFCNLGAGNFIKTLLSCSHSHMFKKKKDKAHCPSPKLLRFPASLYHMDEREPPGIPQSSKFLFPHPPLLLHHLRLFLLLSDKSLESWWYPFYNTRAGLYAHRLLPACPDKVVVVAVVVVVVVVYYYYHQKDERAKPENRVCSHFPSPLALLPRKSVSHTAVLFTVCCLSLSKFEPLCRAF